MSLLGGAVVARLDEKDLEQSLFDRYAMLHKQRRGHYPLLVETECYTYMGQGVKIVSCNVFDSIKNAEVVIESRGSNVATVEFQELSWKFSRATIDSRSEVSENEYIANGPHSETDSANGDILNEINDKLAILLRRSEGLSLKDIENADRNKRILGPHDQASLRNCNSNTA
jgi:hypothetical protein